MRNIFQMRRTYIVVGILVLLVAMALILDEFSAGNISNPTSKNLNNTTVSESGTTPTETQSSSGTTIEPDNPITTEEQSAVLAAATATSSLSSSLFLPNDLMKKVVTEVVAPEMRADVVTTYTTIAPDMARAFGYPNVYEASYRSNYYVRILKYRVEKLGEIDAKIWLYTVSNWTTADGNSYNAPSITVIDLEKSGDKWFYTKAEDPPKNQVPIPETGLSYHETVAKFQPYLRGFSDYVEAAE